MSMTFETGVRFEGGYRLTSPLPNRGMNPDIWLAEGPEPDMTYVVYNLPARQLDAKFVQTIGESINQRQSAHLARFETLLTTEDSDRCALVERVNGELLGPISQGDLVRRSDRLRSLIGAIALLENLGHLIPDLKQSVYLTAHGDPVLLRPGWPTHWFGDAEQPLTRAQDFCAWLLDETPPEGKDSLPKASLDLLRPITEGRANDFSSWWSAIEGGDQRVRSANTETASVRSDNPTAIAGIDSDAKARERTRKQQFWMALSLILAAGFVFIILPQWVAPPDDSQKLPESSQFERAAPEPVVKKSPLEAAKNTLALEQAEALAEEFLRRLLALEDRGLRFWDEAALIKINQSAIEADDFFRQTEGESSLNAYRALIEEVAAIEDRMPSVIDALAADAKALLESNEFKQAEAQYNVLTLLDPDSPFFQAEKAKAQRLPDVMMTIAQAEEQLEQQNPAGALALLENAQSQVPDWPLTLLKLNEAREAVALQTFQRWMSVGFSALESGDFETAQTQFQRALASPLNRGDAEEGLAQLASKQTNQKVDRLQKEFEMAMTEGAWSKALEFLDRLDALSPNSAALVAQREKANERLLLEEEAAGFLADPLQLQSDERLAAARAWIVSMSRLAAPKGAMDQQRLELARLLTLARAAHDVVLTSDGLTFVRLLRSGPEGQLGTLSETRLRLFPGRYTLTGKRLGYVDTRIDFEVPMEAGSINLDIRCKDEL